MKRFLTYFVLLLLFSCASSTLNRIPVGPFSNIALDQHDLDNFFHHLNRSPGLKIDPKALDIVRRQLKAEEYNARIIEKVETHEDFDLYLKYHNEYTASQLYRKIELLRVQIIEKDEYEDYVKSFSQTPDAHSRFLLVDKIASNAQAEGLQAQMLAKIVVMISAELKDNRQKKALYRAFYDHVRGGLTKFNLYAYKNVPLEVLQEAVDYGEQQHIKDAAKFIIEIQNEVQDDYIKEINEIFKRNDLPERDFSDV